MANKLSGYFSHDSNAKDDPKVMIMMAQLGLEAYGIYWILVEYLREQANYKAPLNILDPLARRFGSSREKFETIVTKYGLFETDDLSFWSISLMKRMERVDEKRERLRDNINKRWSKNTNVLQMNNDCTTEVIQSKVKESIVKNIIVKKSKEERKNIPPSFESLSAYCFERKSNVDPRQFFDFYESKGWMIGKDKMKDWQAAVRTWEQRTTRDASSDDQHTPVSSDILSFMYPGKKPTDGQK